MRALISFLFVTLFLLTACESFDPQKQFDEDLATIENYLSTNNLQAERDPSGLYYNIEDAGSAAKPTINSGVKVYYKGFFLDGSVFDEVALPDDPGTFNLNSLILAWQIGIQKIGRGGKIRLYVPSILGYGERGSGRNVPPNSILIFDIELVDFS